MAVIKMDIGWQRRRAIYRPIVDKPEVGLTKNSEVLVKVWGCFQIADGVGGSNPYFVAELPSGKCTYAAPEDIQFIEFEEDEED